VGVLIGEELIAHPPGYQKDVIGIIAGVHGAQGLRKNRLPGSSSPLKCFYCGIN
jgi:hypothetical protein